MCTSEQEGRGKSQKLFTLAWPRSLHSISRILSLVQSVSMGRNVVFKNHWFSGSNQFLNTNKSHWFFTLEYWVEKRLRLIIHSVYGFSLDRTQCVWKLSCRTQLRYLWMRTLSKESCHSCCRKAVLTGSAAMCSRKHLSLFFLKKGGDMTCMGGSRGYALVVKISAVIIAN